MRTVVAVGAGALFFALLVSELVELRRKAT
jgi:hypothetical protein